MDACCSPIATSPLDEDGADRLAARFRALGDPARLRLLSLIACCGETCACDLVDEVGVSQPTVSHHLKVLYEAGLVDRERRGRWIHYWVVPEAMAELSAAVQPPPVQDLVEIGPRPA